MSLPSASCPKKCSLSRGARRATLAALLALLAATHVRLCGGGSGGQEGIECAASRGVGEQRAYPVDRETMDIFVALDFPRTHPEAVVAALIAVFERRKPPDQCLMLEQLIDVAAELRVRLSRERLLSGLHAAQLLRIQRLSEGRPAVAAQLYAAAAAADPHVPTYHLHLGGELAALGNLTSAASAFAAAILAAGQAAARQEGAEGAKAAEGAEGGGGELVRARLSLALALEALGKRGHGDSAGDGAVWPRGAGDGGAGAGALLGDSRVAEQYLELLRLYPDAHALWYRLARVLRLGSASSYNAAAGARAMIAALRLFASSSRVQRANSSGFTQVNSQYHTGWERVGYLHGATTFADAVSRYGAWQERCVCVCVCVCMCVCVCVCVHACV